MKQFIGEMFLIMNESGSPMCYGLFAPDKNSGHFKVDWLY